MEDAIRDTLAAYEATFNRLGFTDLIQYWDTSEPQPFYLAEEDAPHQDWDAIRHYLAFTASITKRLRVRFSDIRAREVAPGLAHVFYQMRWMGQFGTQPALGGDNRVVGLMRQTPDGWRWITYAEAPLAAITQVKRGLQIYVDQDFLDESS